MHQVCRLLLDEEFMEAYRHGIVLRCADGILRRVFPRIFTYSADYPEKYAVLSCFTNLFNLLTRAAKGCSWPLYVTRDYALAQDVLFQRPSWTC
jgi:Plavaka transposase